LTQTAISYWESAKRTPGLDELVDLAEVLDVNVEVFLPPGHRRQPVTAVLRATVERIASGELQDAVEALADEADRAVLPPREFEVAASAPSHAANELLEKAGVTGPPIDIERLAQRCGVLVLHRSFPDSLSGLVFSQGEGAVIGINAAHHRHRKRFFAGP
jgi:transcriptional regulator with XRE-family HTH domain